MSKFKKATKRITAVAGSALMVSSAVFGAGLSDYPNNFVSGGDFDGQVVVGATADAMDSTSASSIISDLSAQFSGSTEQVKITYKKSSTGGDTVNAVKSTNKLNYGETLGATTETGGFDDGDSDVLQDEDFDNGFSDEEYEQTLELTNGEFNYALRDEVEGIDKIADGIFYNNDDSFAVYTMDLKNVINLSSSSDLNGDFVGRDLRIMGNEFTIGTINKATNGELTKIELLGGSNKVSLGEGETTSVTVDGTSYEVSVQSVSSSAKVLLTVNGVSASIDEFDTEDVAGVSIAVTDLVDSSRDSVKGYAEIVVGGQKVTLEDGQKLVKVNDDDVDDLFEGYEVYSDFSDAGSMDIINITYQVSDDTLLQTGDSLKDVLFDSFELVFDGVSSAEYATVDLRVSDDDITVDGTTIGGDSFDREFIHTTSTNGTNGVTYLKGDQDADRIFFGGSAYLGVSNDDGTNGIRLLNSSGGTGATITQLVFDFDDNSIDGNGIMVYDDSDEQYLYEIDSVDTNDVEVDVVEFLQDKDQEGMTITEFGDDLEVDLTTTSNATSVNITIPASQLLASMGFENELMMNFSGAEATSGVSTTLIFSLDDDADGDDSTDINETFSITTSWDSSDDEFNLNVGNSDTDFVNRNDADDEDGSTDVKTLVTVYGTKVQYDNDENTWVKIMTPEEQTYAMVDVVFGGSGASSGVRTVDSDQVDATIADLEGDGFTVTGQETVAAEDVDFDVSAPVLDSDVSGMSDMIVVGGPAVNSVAADLLGLSFPTTGTASGVSSGEAVIRFFESSNSVLVYGWDAADTKAAADRLNDGGLSGSTVNVN